MAWTIIETCNFGKFFPNASLDEWRERMAARLENEMTEEERAEFEGRAANYCLWISEKFRDCKGFLEEHEQPHVLTTERYEKTLGDFLISENGIRIVSAAFKSAVESVEPGVHQFWPMTVESTRGKVTPGTFFGMIVGQQRASFSQAESDPASFNPYSSPGGLKPPKNKKIIRGVALESAAIGDAHMWLEKELWSLGVVISDTLHAILEQQGLCLPKVYEMREI